MIASKAEEEHVADARWHDLGPVEMAAELEP